MAPGTTGSGKSVLVMVSPWGAGAEVTEVEMVAEVLLRSLLSGIVLFGSTTAVLAMFPGVGGAVALMGIVALEPWLTAPPSQVIVTGVPLEVQTKRLVVFT